MSLNRRRFLRGTAMVSGGAAIAGGAAGLSLYGSAVAEAAAMPGIHSPAEWRARLAIAVPTILDRRPDRLVVHHTASANTRDRSLRHAFALAREIQRSHLRRGWNDSGQQFTISRGGHIMVGRRHALAAVRSGRHLVGAHVAGYNTRALGIENEGTYTRTRPPAAQLSSLVAMLAWLCDEYGLDPRRAIVGHRDLNATECPGDGLYRLLPAIRARVARRLGRSGGTKEAPLVAPAPANLPGPRAPLDHGPAIGPDETTR